jgi:hypothetical protein
VFDIFYYDWSETHQDCSPFPSGDGQGNGFLYGYIDCGDGFVDIKIDVDVYNEQFCFDYEYEYAKTHD